MSRQERAFSQRFKNGALALVILTFVLVLVVIGIVLHLPSIFSSFISAQAGRTLLPRTCYRATPPVHTRNATKGIASPKMVHC